MISHLGSPEQFVTLGNGAFLVARDQARLKALSSRLVGETGRSITPLPADLNDTDVPTSQLDFSCCIH